MKNSSKPNRDDSQSGLNIIKVNGKSLADTTVYKNLGMNIEAFGGMKEDMICHKVPEGERVLNNLRELF